MKEITLLNKSSANYHDLADPMFSLRHAVFKQRLGWSVNTTNNKEFDEYDDEKEASYVIVTEQGQNEVLGCMRLLPTTGPYMLKNTFPEIAKDFLLPEQKDIWEISRFAVQDKSQNNENKFGFGETTKHLAAGMCDFAIRNGIKSYVGLTTPHVERLIRNLGLTCNRLGKVEKIEDLKVVTIEIIMDEKGIQTVKEKLAHDRLLSIANNEYSFEHKEQA